MFIQHWDDFCHDGFDLLVQVLGVNTWVLKVTTNCVLIQLLCILIQVVVRTGTGTMCTELGYHIKACTDTSTMCTEGYHKVY